MSTSAQVNEPASLQVDESASLIYTLIRPAILKLISESEGAYRCERDLHHHFTTCLNSIKSLELGTHRRRVYLEEPTLACYGSGRKGNLDYFFPQYESGDFQFKSSRNGVAVELNFDYRDGYQKIRQDVQKLIDPESAFKESLYFVYCKKANFLDAVRDGIERAFNEFVESRLDFRLPLGFHVILVENLRQGGHIVREMNINMPCLPCEIVWTESPHPPASFQPTQQTPPDEDECAGPYVLNKDFSREELRMLIAAFESKVKRQRDLSLARRLRIELLESETPKASPALIKQLSKWCKTDGIYSDGMYVARRISDLLFGRVLDRSQLGA
ncbi:MAG TPA: hypothetical protein VI386_24935 [Candidatus Sulfotelmatobacter sp.]